MFSLLSILSLLNFFIIFFIGLSDGYLLLLILLPWTIFVYISLVTKGFRISEDNLIYHYSGRLYWIGKRSFQATLLASLNLIISALIIPNTDFTNFDQQFGPLSSLLILFFLPMPGILIMSLTNNDREKLYNLMHQKLLQADEAPIFLVLTNNLLIKHKQYSDEYFKQIEEIRKNVYEYLEAEFPQITPFIDINASYHLNLENLAIILTRKIFSQNNSMGEIKSNP
ncbi:MAG: hypothetical protein ACXABI_07015 [Candidatus Hodarchaeales archaeon]